jgi:hypothetical protein
MLAFPNVFHFFAHKLACLSGRRFAFARILARAFDWFFFWHNKMVSPLATRLDVKKAAGVISRRCLIGREPILSSAFFAAALLASTAALLATAAFLAAAALLAATALLATTALFFTLALLALTLLSLAILLLAPLLSGTTRFARFVWILSCVHDALSY